MITNAEPIGRRRARAGSWFLLLALLTFPCVAIGQISPGPLSRPHQQFDGPAGCTQCHEVSAGSPKFLCLECHREIATRVAQRRGYHGQVVSANAASADCVRCHSEHNGRDFRLVRWLPSREAFDHAATEFPLDGKHRLDCAKCHTRQRFTPASGAPGKNPERTFLGLARECSSCHEDKHRGQLGANCLRCHNTTDWRAAKSFDHSKARFALTGAHQLVACAKCHVSSAGTPKYTGLRFDGCAACHRDPHRGTFQQKCETCHSTLAWRRTSMAARFDHSRTKFVLTGKHSDVGCSACHRAGDFKTPIAHERCADCHKPDPHNGQFAKRADGGACDSCHTVNGFKPAKFEVADHDKTGFPLREKHAQVACAKCHQPAGKATLFKVKFSRCTDCHKDAHAGQFAAMPYGNDCAKCHTERGFRPSTYTLARHKAGNFVLTGGHVATACNECHKPEARLKSAQYHFATVACTACHADPHRGQFGARMQARTARGEQVGCQACHTTNDWRELNGFDHSTTAFPLDGVHRGVTCADCHQPPNMERTLRNVDFKAAPTECQDCHRDPHGAQFAVAGVTRCAECHNTSRWRPTLFDHEKTKFSLAGAHQNVRCATCHIDARTIGGRKVVIYNEAPLKCASCHAGPTLAGTTATRAKRREQP